MTLDRDDNTSGQTWPTLAAMIRELTDALGFLRIPADLGLELDGERIKGVGGDPGGAGRDDRPTHDLRGHSGANTASTIS